MDWTKQSHYLSKKSSRDSQVHFESNVGPWPPEQNKHSRSLIVTVL